MKLKGLPAGIELRRGRGKRHLFLDLENKPPGLKDFIAMVDQSRRLGKFVILDVNPQRRRIGVGTKWVRWFEEYAKQLGAIIIVGKVFPGSEGFWTKMGYELEQPKAVGHMLRMKRILSER